MDPLNATGVDSLEPKFDLRVTGRDDSVISASIWPTNLSANHVSGMVDWEEGTDLLSSVIHADGDETPWGQRLLLVWAAAGPHSVSAVPLLGATKWLVAKLTLPDSWGSAGDTVCVSINSGNWRATLSVTCQPELDTEQEIPLALRHLEVGSVIVEMMSRLLLGHSWLTLELTP